MKNNSREKDIPGYLYSVDGLRAVSMLLIFFFHNWQQSWVFFKVTLPSGRVLLDFSIFQCYGYIALEAFFVLSGFCLFYPIAREMLEGAKHITWKEFYVKRLRRILPAYFTMLLLLMIFPVLSYEVYNPKSIKDIFVHFGSHFTFTHIYSNQTVSSVIPTAWTLGVETAFYIIFPLIAAVFRRRPVLTFLAMLLTCQSLRIMTAGMLDLNSFAATISPILYIDIFGWGMLSAYFVVLARNRLKNIEKLRLFMTVIAVLCLVLIYMFMKWMSKADSIPYATDKTAMFRMYYRFIADGAFALFLFAAPFSYRFFHEKVCGNRFFVFLSTISYSFYLWHQNIHIFLRKMNIPYTSLKPPMLDTSAMQEFIAVSTVMSFTVAVISTYLIERPFMRYGIRGTIKKILFIIKSRG